MVGVSLNLLYLCLWRLADEWGLGGPSDSGCSMLVGCTWVFVGWVSRSGVAVFECLAGDILQVFGFRRLHVGWLDGTECLFVESGFM